MTMKAKMNEDVNYSHYFIIHLAQSSNNPHLLTLLALIVPTRSAISLAAAGCPSSPHDRRTVSNHLSPMAMVIPAEFEWKRYHVVWDEELVGGLQFSLAIW